MKIFDEGSRWSAVTLPLLAGVVLALLGHAALTDPRFIEQLGDRAARKGDHTQAMACYRKTMAMYPDYASAPCALAREQAAAGDLLQAQHTLEANLKRHPRDAATNEQLADLVVRSLGEMAYPTAQKYYEAALARDPTRAGAALGLSAIYLAQDRLPDAYRILLRPLKEHDDDAALHLRMAAIYTRARAYEYADNDFNLGTALDSKNADAYDAWGVMRIDAGKPDRAQTVLRRAIELQPDKPQYHVHQAQALRQEGQLDDSEKELTAALKNDIHYVPVYLEIASTLQKARDDESAERYLRLCVQVNPKSTEGRLALADFLTTTTDPLRRNLWEAADLRHACVNDATDPDESLLLGAALGWERVRQMDLSLMLMDRALAWGQLHNLPADEMARLRKYRQRYELALMPELEGPPTFRSVEGRVVPDATDVPWPDVRQPAIESLLDKPTRLDQAPGPGSAFDPALYLGNSSAPPYQAGIRP